MTSNVGRSSAAPAAPAAPPALRDGTARQLQQKVREEQVASRLPSLVAGIVRQGTLAWWGSAGAGGIWQGERPTSDTQYRIGSISKTHTAVAVMRLRDEGVLELTDRIGDHLRELAHLPVTVAQLLSHTSGLRAETTGDWWERTRGAPFAHLASTSLRTEDLLTRPGRRFHYSNVGYAVLGELVSRKRGRPLRDVLSDELFTPLGMERTTPRPVPPAAEGLAVHPHAAAVLTEPEHDAGSMAPAGQLWSTIEDLAKWSRLVTGLHPEILSGESLAEMREPAAVTDLPGQPWVAAYGLGFQLWNHAGRRRHGHAGAMPGHWAMLYMDLETTYGVVALSNSTYAGMRPAFFEELLSLSAAAEPPVPVEFSSSAESSDPALLELAGSWYWGPAEYRVTISPAGTLVLRHGPEDCNFVPNGDGTYTGESGYFAAERLVVHRDGGWVTHLQVASFVLTRVPYDPPAVIPGGVDRAGWHAG